MAELNFPNLEHVRGESAVRGYAVNLINSGADEITDSGSVSYGDVGADIEANNSSTSELTGARTVSGRGIIIAECYFNIIDNDDNIGIGVWNGDFSNVSGTVFYPNTGDLVINGTVEHTTSAVGTFHEQYLRLEMKRFETRLILEGDVSEDITISEGAEGNLDENLRITADSTGGENRIVVPWIKHLMAPSEIL